MNSHQTKGALSDAKGQVKQAAGAQFGSTRTQAEGITDQIKGKVEKGFGNLKEKATELKDKVKESVSQAHRDSSSR